MIVGLKAKLRRITEGKDEYSVTLQRLKSDDCFVYIPEITELAVGKYGYVRATMEVQQVVGPDEVIVTVGGTRIWLKGFDTSTTTDDQQIVYAKPIIFSKTKKYHTAIGGSVTCLYAEPFPALEYIAIVE